MTDPRSLKLLLRVAIGVACIVLLTASVFTNADAALARIVLTADDEGDGGCRVAEDSDDDEDDDDDRDEDGDDGDDDRDDGDGDEGDEDDDEGRDCPSSTTTTTTPTATTTVPATTTEPTTTTTVPPTTTRQDPTELPPRPPGGTAPAREPAPPGAAIVLAARTIDLTRNGHLRLVLTCPTARSVPCRGVVSLERAGAARVMAARRGRSLGRRRFVLAPGTSRGVVIKIARDRVKAGRGTPVRVRVSTSNPGVAATTSVQRIRLKLARRGRP